MNDDPRLFVAVPLTPEATSAVAEIVERIRAGEPEGRGVRWVRLEGLHLTLRFLGPTPEGRVPDLTAAIGAVARDAQRTLHRHAHTADRALVEEAPDERHAVRHTSGW